VYPDYLVVERRGYRRQQTFNTKVSPFFIREGRSLVGVGIVMNSS
jgi:hypothetical protein